MVLLLRKQPKSGDTASLYYYNYWYLVHRNGAPNSHSSAVWVVCVCVVTAVCCIALYMSFVSLSLFLFVLPYSLPAAASACFFFLSCDGCLSALYPQLAPLYSSVYHYCSPLSPPPYSLPPTTLLIALSLSSFLACSVAVSPLPRSDRSLLLSLYLYTLYTGTIL